MFLEAGSDVPRIVCALGALACLQYLSSEPGRAALLALDSSPVRKCLCSEPGRKQFDMSKGYL